MKPAKTSKLYIEIETFSENGGGENDHNSATETNGKYDNCENDFDKTENDLVTSTDSLDGELGDEDEDEEEEVVKVASDPAASDLAVLLREGNRLRATVEEMTRARTNTDNELVNLRINLEEAKNENVTILQELEKTRLKLASVERVAAEKEVLVKKLEESCRQETSKDTIRDSSMDTIRDTSKDASKDTSANSSNQETLDSLRNRLKALEAENAQLKAKYASEEQAMDKVQLPQPLEEKSRLEVDVTTLEEELETLATASRTLTACTVLPILVLIIAIVIAFLPFVSQLFGTRGF